MDNNSYLRFDYDAVLGLFYIDILCLFYTDMMFNSQWDAQCSFVRLQKMISVFLF